MSLPEDSVQTATPGWRRLGEGTRGGPCATSVSSLTSGVAAACCGGPIFPIEIPVATVTCSACASYSQLNAVAQSYFQQWDRQTPTGYPQLHRILPQGFAFGSVTYPGTVVFVVSTTYALSSAFRYTGSASAGISIVAVSTPSNAGAIATDGRVFARSARVPIIQMPSNIPHDDTDEVITGTLAGILVFTGQSAPSLWHGLFAGDIGQVIQGTFRNLQDGMTYQIWSNDTIIVRFGDGYTVLVKWNPLAPTAWTIVPNSLRDKSGKPVNAVPPPSQSPGGGTENLGSATVPPSSSIIFFPTTSQDSPLPEGEVFVEPIEPIDSGGGGGTVFRDNDLAE